MRRDEAPAVGAEGDVVDPRAACLGPGNGPDDLPGSEVPDPQRRGATVVRVKLSGARGEAPAVGAEGEPEDRLCMRFEDAEPAARGRVPDPDRPLVAPARDQGAVGAEGDGGDAALVASQGHEGAARRRLPDPDGPVLAAAGDPVAVGAEGDGAIRD